MKEWWHKGVMGLFGATLLLAVGMPPGAQADDEAGNGTAASGGRVLYRPISYYSNASDGFSGRTTAASAVEQALLAVLAHVPEPVELRYMPLKRAISLYIVSADACVVAPRNGQEEPDLVSDVFYANPFWVYVRADSAFQSYKDLKTFGSIDGADMIAGQVVFGHLERTFAPNFQSLIAMLLSGRVDAIPLGELALDNEGDLMPRMRRMTEEPFLTLDMRIRCKPSGENEAFIGAVNKAIAAIRAAKGGAP
jgi:hypothetical protein